MENVNIEDLKTLQEVEQYRKEMNEACDKRASYISMCQSAYNLSEKSFGYIKESFESLAPELFTSKYGRAIMNKYITTIKENANLASLHNIYENVRKANSSIDVDYFMNSLSQIDWNINHATLKEDVKKLGMILSEAYLHLGTGADAIIPEENVELHKAVEFIAENKKNSKNLAKYGEAVKVIKENISKKEDTEKNEEDFNFEKGKCLAKIENALGDESTDEDTKKRLETVKEQVTRKEFNPETFVNDIQNLNDISKLF